MIHVKLISRMNDHKHTLEILLCYYFVGLLIPLEEACTAGRVMCDAEESWNPISI